MSPLGVESASVILACSHISAQLDCDLRSLEGGSRFVVRWGTLSCWLPKSVTMRSVLGPEQCGDGWNAEISVIPAEHCIATRMIL